MEDKLTVTFPGGKRVQGEYNGFKVLTDRPVAQGGEGAAPTSYELFLISLATCAGYYAKAFCEERGLNTDGMKVVQFHVQDETGKLKAVRLEVHPPADFPKKYISALVNSVQSCKVKRALTSPPQLEVEIK